MRNFFITLGLVVLGLANSACSKGFKFGSSSNKSDSSVQVSTSADPLSNDDANSVAELSNGITDTLFEDLFGISENGSNFDWDLDNKSSFSFNCPKGGSLAVSAQVVTSSSTTWTSFSADITSGTGKIQFTDCKIQGKNGDITINGSVELLNLLSSIDSNLNIDAGSYAFTSDYDIKIKGTLTIESASKTHTCAIDIVRQASNDGQILTDPKVEISSSVVANLQAKVCDQSVSRNFSYNLN